MDLNNQDLTFLSRLKPSRGSWGPISKLTGNSIFFNFFTIPNNMGVYGLPSTSATKIWPFWADLPHGEPDARGWSREAAELPSSFNMANTKRRRFRICKILFDNLACAWSFAGDGNSNVTSLFNILTTFALNHPSVGYCQVRNFTNFHQNQRHASLPKG